MSTLYTRTGSLKAPNAQDAKGRPTWHHIDNCTRCGGLGGGEQWRYTGWTCFQCGGTGKGSPRVDRLYTTEELAKLNDIRDRRRAKVEAARKAVYEAERAERWASAAGWLEENAASIDCIRGAFEIAAPESYAKNSLRKFLQRIDDRNIVSWIDDALAIAIEVYARQDDKARSQHFGVVGTRQEVTFEVTFSLRFDSTQWGWPPSYLTVGRTPEGNVVVYKGSHGWDKGETVTAKWGIKEHGERDGVLQTVLARPTFPKEQA